MSKRNISKVLAATVALALASAAVQAGTSGPKGASKEQKVGMATGAATGALVGGPFGAAVGFIVGAISGASIGEANRSKQTVKTLEQQLADARNDLVKLAASKQTEQNSIVEQLAQRLHADLLFRTASAELDAAAAQKLSDLGAVLGAYPDLIIEIDGYADPRGKSESNDELSQQRAAAVRAALIVGGAAPERIRMSAHGEKLSTAAKDDLEAYAWERRVSLSVLPSTPVPSSSQVAQAK